MLRVQAETVNGGSGSLVKAGNESELAAALAKDAEAGRAFKFERRGTPLSVSAPCRPERLTGHGEPSRRFGLPPPMPLSCVPLQDSSARFKADWLGAQLDAFEEAMEAAGEPGLCFPRSDDSDSDAETEAPSGGGDAEGRVDAPATAPWAAPEDQRPPGVTARLLPVTVPHLPQRGAAGGTPTQASMSLRQRLSIALNTTRASGSAAGLLASQNAAASNDTHSGSPQPLAPACSP